MSARSGWRICTASWTHAIEEVRTSFGKSYPMMIGGQAVKAAGEFDDRSPIDTRILLGKFQQRKSRGRSAGDRRRQIGIPKLERPTMARTRDAAQEKVADGIRAHRWELSALMGYEAGKNRLECVGDVEESADLIEILLQPDRAA